MTALGPQKRAAVAGLDFKPHRFTNPERANKKQVSKHMSYAVCYTSTRAHARNLHRQGCKLFHKLVDASRFKMTPELNSLQRARYLLNM